MKLLFVYVVYMIYLYIIKPTNKKHFKSKQYENSLELIKLR